MKDVWGALSPGSNSQYTRAWEKFVSFMRSIMKKPYLPASEQSVAAYVAYLHHTQKLKVSTIRSHLSAITFNHKIHSHPSPAKSFVVNKLLSSYEKPEAVHDERLPITDTLLSAILAKVPLYASDRREAALLSALFALMYHGCLRVSEVASTDGPTDHNLAARHVYITRTEPRYLVIAFRSYKHSPPNPPPLHISPTACRDCPLELYRAYATYRPSQTNKLKAFCFPDASPITRDYVLHSLRGVLSLTKYSNRLDRYNTHSFRIGRATDMAARGATDQQIQMIGRWKTTAFKKYIRPLIVSAGKWLSRTSSAHL